MVRELVPVLVAVTDWEALPPTEAVTETELGVTEICAVSGDGGVLADVLTPPTHPAK
jgi:hypothetical protein